MKEITLEELLEAGCHFGHQVNRRSPKAREFIFESRANVDIINLEDTQKGLTEACAHLTELAARGGTAILVGTKRQAQEITREIAAKAQEEGSANLFFVSSRWIGGTLTNFSEVKKNFKRLFEITEIINNKDPRYTKREIGKFAEERQKLLNFYGGIAKMEGIPDALIVIDTRHERTAVTEAKKMGVEVVGVVDTNGDPGAVEYPIPSNDDAVGAITLLTRYLVESWVEGERKFQVESEKKRIEDEKKREEIAKKVAEAQQAEKDKKEREASAQVSKVKAL